MNAINISNLRKSYDGKINALNNISLSIQKGEIFGFLGPNGSGKTTTVRILNGILNGILSSTSGHAEILWKSVNEHNLELHRLCGVMTESSSCWGKSNILWKNAWHGRKAAEGMRRFHFKKARITRCKK